MCNKLPIQSIFTWKVCQKVTLDSMWLLNGSFCFCNVLFSFVFIYVFLFLAVLLLSIHRKPMHRFGCGKCVTKIVANLIHGHNLHNWIYNACICPFFFSFFLCFDMVVVDPSSCWSQNYNENGILNIVKFKCFFPLSICLFFNVEKYT